MTYSLGDDLFPIEHNPNRSPRITGSGPSPLPFCFAWANCALHVKNMMHKTYIKHLTNTAHLCIIRRKPKPDTERGAGIWRRNLS